MANQAVSMFLGLKKTARDPLTTDEMLLGVSDPVLRVVAQCFGPQVSR